MKYALLSANQDDNLSFEAPTPAIAGLTVLHLGWPCTGARSYIRGPRKGAAAPDVIITSRELHAFLKSVGAMPPGRAMRENRAAVIAALASVRREGPAPAGLIDLAARAHEWAAILRAASAPVASLKEAAE